MRWMLGFLAAGALAGALGCDGDDGGDGGGGQRSVAFKRKLAAAQRPAAADFPAARGKTLQQIADGVEAVRTGLATSEFTLGQNRVAFGVLGRDNRFIYASSAVYVAPTPSDPARGPFPAPADPLVVDPPFRSQNAALESDAIAAIYDARVRFDRPGRYAVLVVTNLASGPVGGAAEIQVKRDSPIPAVGERPPRVETDTLASAGGDVEAIDTRKPPDDMHQENFAGVLGDKPVVLLMATPALCQTRVCGPVTDIAAQLQQEYSDRAVSFTRRCTRTTTWRRACASRCASLACAPSHGCSPSTVTAGWRRGSRALSVTARSGTPWKRRSTGSSSPAAGIVTKVADMG